jgi:23S rRNA pseudouridine1911/1915/1917 synthase
VLLNGVLEKASTAVAEGDIIDFELTPRAPLEVLPQAIPLDIIYEDDDLLVVDKPAGMVTHPAHGTRDGTLVNALLAHAGALPGDVLRPGLVHRLDRDTSGLLVVAKNEATLGALGKAMMRRFIAREYLGLVSGIPDRAEGTIEGAIGRDPQNRLRYAIRADGRPAVTHYALRETLRNASELTFRLETGRTHQIRVHLAAFGHALINDPLYGRSDRRVELPGQALHAWRLRFRHPATRKELEFEAPPPAAYQRAKEILRG